MIHIITGNNSSEDIDKSKIEMLKRTITENICLLPSSSVVDLLITNKMTF